MEQFGIKGTVRIYNKDKSILYREYKNAFTNSGKNAMMNFLKGGFMTDGYSHLSIGTGNDPVDLDETHLQNEVFRKEFSSAEVVDNKLILDCLIESNEANTSWQELGLVVGGSAAELNSGTLFNRVSVFEKKDQTSTITVSWTIEIIST